MTTMIIEIPDSSDVKNIAVAVRQLKGVAKVAIKKDKAPNRIPGLAYTQEERIATIRKAEENYAAGVPGIPHDEIVSRMDKKIASWK